MGLKPIPKSQLKTRDWIPKDTGYQQGILLLRVLLPGQLRQLHTLNIRCFGLLFQCSYLDFASSSQNLYHDTMNAILISSDSFILLLNFLFLSGWWWKGESSLAFTYWNWGASRQSSMLGRLVRPSRRVWATFSGYSFAFMDLSNNMIVSSVWKISWSTWRKAEWFHALYAHKIRTQPTLLNTPIGTTSSLECHFA